VISLLDTFEEFGTLSLDEWNLTDILKSHVITLPENQKAYWKERGKINWVKLGDGNTKFFHTRATINYRKRYISTLKDETNNDIADHAGKAEILSNSFKKEWASLIIQKCTSIFRKYMRTVWSAT
jgi:hypothetical protein